LKASGSYSLAGSYTSSCQTITDVAAANSFMSTLLLLACSNRSIQLVDAATMQVRCCCPWCFFFNKCLAHQTQLGLQAVCCITLHAALKQ
jgi:hypothetical protein